MPALDVHWIWDALNFLVSFSLVLLATRRTLTQEHNVAFFINFLFSFVYLLFCIVSIDLHRASPTTGPTLTRVLIGDAQPKMRLVGPHRAAL